MIDCDIHVQITDVEEILQFVEPAERDWFRNASFTLGLPDYPWPNPSTWFRLDLAVDESGMPGGNPQTVAKEALDNQGADLGILTADDALSVGMVANLYRSATVARAHDRVFR